jgi:hypothetical protein
MEAFPVPARAPGALPSGAAAFDDLRLSGYAARLAAAEENLLPRALVADDRSFGLPAVAPASAGRGAASPCGLAALISYSAARGNLSIAESRLAALATTRVLSDSDTYLLRRIFVESLTIAAWIARRMSKQSYRHARRTGLALFLLFFVPADGKP